MAYLILNNGEIFEGTRFGAPGDALGEFVFTTGMVGCVETLTDPSYAGQIVMQTFPMIGNYGVTEADFEGKSALNAYVVREYCEKPSNFRCDMTLDTYLKSRGIVGLCGVDTRALTKIVREQGVMNALICDKIPQDLSALHAYTVSGVVRLVTCEKKKTFAAAGERRFRVALMDYGAKRGIVENLTARGCEVTVFPAFTEASEVLAGGFDGVMLSNGPGDPAENTFEIGEIAKIVGVLPVFGICLGHQLTALAMGGRTEKLKYGHRGANQPVRDKKGTRTFITSQNHGYAVVASTLKNTAVESFVNANDGSCEGLDYPGKRCFTVQFHPEARSGPHDTAFLFDRFIAMMGGEDRA